MDPGRFAVLHTAYGHIGVWTSAAWRSSAMTVSAANTPTLSVLVNVILLHRITSSLDRLPAGIAELREEPEPGTDLTFLHGDRLRLIFTCASIPDHRGHHGPAAAPGETQDHQRWYPLSGAGRVSAG
jgi:hypothetical protein